MEYAKAVVEFNREILGIQQRSVASLSIKEANHGVKCLQEELDEFTEAVAMDNFVGTVDALIDLTYFATGLLYKLGLTPEQIHKCQMAVHAANMSKKKGVVAKRDTGAPDAIKPEGWVPPEARITAIIFK